jgi:AcrR family transcriptional regulator
MENKSVTTTSSKQELILNAASTIFLIHGFSAATTDMIQKEAGVSKKTLYACFPSKESLFISVIEYQCNLIAQSFNTICANGNIHKTLTDLGKLYLQLILSSSTLDLFRIIIAETPRFPEIGHRFYKAGPKVIYERLAGYLTEAAKNGEIDIHSIGASTASSLFISMLRGEAHLEALTHHKSSPSEVQIDQWVKIAVETFLTAFKSSK